jgi:hypothetical protein
MISMKTTVTRTITTPQILEAPRQDSFLVIDKVAKVYPLPKGESYTVLEGVYLPDRSLRLW